MIGTDPDYLRPVHADLRLSDEERRAAVSALAQEHARGRLTEEELDDRSARARAATTRGDLAPLFVDLPVSVPAAPARHRSAARFGVMAIALSPFVAVTLFFLTGLAGGWPLSWLWFLLIPVTAIVVSAFRPDRAG